MPAPTYNSSSSIPPEVLLFMMQQEQAKRQQQAQGQGQTGLTQALVGGGGGGAAASQIGGGSALASTPAANAAFNEAAGLASQASWNAGATQAGGGLPAAAVPEAGTWSAGAALPMTIGGALALHGGYKSFRNFGKGDWKGGAKSGAETGAGIGTMILPGVGTLVGTGAGALAGGLLGSIKTGKHKDQIGRDANRSVLKDKGIYDSKYTLQLLDGSKKNMGLDGSKGQYNIDFSDTNNFKSDFSGRGDQLIARLNPFGEVISGGNEKRRTDLVGELYNAIKDSKDPNAEIRSLYERAGINPQNFQTNSKDADIYRNSLSQVFGGQSNMGKAISTIPTQKLPQPLQKPNSSNIFSGDFKPYTPPNKDPNDPNKYGIDSNGNVIGTLIGYFPSGMKAPDIANGITGVFGGSQSTLPTQKLPLSLSPQRSTTSSPGIGLDGKRINYSQR